MNTTLDTRRYTYEYEDDDLICPNLSVNDEGHLLFAGQDTELLARKYGTPLYLYDEERIRQKCRSYMSAVNTCFQGRGKVLYASKAASFKRIYEIIGEEGLGSDVVSLGEIVCCQKAGFPLEKTYFHSNNKTDEDISYGVINGVGHFVVDNEEELYAISRIAGEAGVTQKVLLRITPGIDPHTYEQISTGKVDSKFGSAIETGQADEITKIALSLPNIHLSGFHCHVGSQVFDAAEVYTAAVDAMLNFIAHIKEVFDYEAEQLNLGGGFGVRYIKSQPQCNIEKNIEMIANEFFKVCTELKINPPVVCFEPGRSIVADAGLTLYTVGTVKRIPGYKNYVSIDGGMTDNPRFALYQAPYTVIPADNVFIKRTMVSSIVGRCCESGDIIAEGIRMPEGIKRGSILACLTTGAYHYSMASNYNKIPKCPIVMLSGGKSYVAVRRETPEDLLRYDV